MLRIILSFLACIGCAHIALITKWCKYAWIVLSGAMFWILGGNILIYQLGEVVLSWHIRWVPFYVMVILACIIALLEIKFKKNGQ